MITGESFSACFFYLELNTSAGTQKVASKMCSTMLNDLKWALQK